MIANIGYLLLVLGMVCSALAAAISLFTFVKNKNTHKTEIKFLTITSTLAVSAAFLLAVYVLVISDFNFEMVYDNTSLEMNLLQKITAVWGNKSGSLLFWSFLLSLCVSVTVLGKWKGKKESYFHGVMLLLHLINVFFIALITFRTNPFTRLWLTSQGDVVAAVFAPQGTQAFTPLDGQGLNPLLKHTGMVIHPPLLYLGFILYFVPFAFALVSLWKKDYSATWIETTRGWILLAWIFLTAGILLGCWWAYDILGWGGYWSWDPVEIAGLMPWLSALGLIHCMDLVHTDQHIRRWAYRHIIATVLLIVFGIYLSRTGVVSSVHAYSQSSIGPPFMGFFLFLVLISLGSLAARAKDLRPQQEHKPALSRPGLVRVLSLCLTALVLICLVGVTLPLTSQALSGQRTEPAQIYYEWNFAPFLIIIFVTTALGFLPPKERLIKIAAAIALFFTTLLGVLLGKMNLPAFVGFAVILFQIAALLLSVLNDLKPSAGKEKKYIPFSRWASILLHLGFALLALGVVSSSTLEETQVVSLQNGQSVAVADWQVTKRASQVEMAAGEQVLFAEEYQFNKKDKTDVILTPHILWYADTGSTVSVPSIHSTLAADRYAAILTWDGTTNGDTTVLLSVFPLMIWMWIGGVLLLLGALGYFIAACKYPRDAIKKNEQL